MRIGLVTDFYFPWVAGPASLVRNLSQGLTARGHSVSLLAPSPFGAPYSELEGRWEVTRAATVPSPFGYHLRVSIRPFRAVDDWLDRVQPELVHIHHPFPICAAAVLAARPRGIPVLATNHTVPECTLWGIRRLGPAYTLARTALGRWIVALLGRCQAVATPTRTAADALRSMGYLGDVLPISNGVDTDRFAPGTSDDALRNRLGLDDRPIVLYTGRLDPDKEMGVWLRAAAAQTPTEAQFVIGGQGTDRPRLERLARELGLAGRTKFIGYVSDADLPALYRAASAYFITSPVELQSITTLEAIASGLPVVAVSAQALPELVHNGRNGYLVPPADSRAAGAALGLLLGDVSGRKAMAEASRTMALRHDLDRTIEAYEGMYHAALSAARGGQPVERTAPAEL